MAPDISRRRFLAGLGATTAAGLVVGSGGAVAAQTQQASPGAQSVDFYAQKQAGIVTEQQDRLCFAAFDVLSEERADLITLLRKWTEAAALMAEGSATGDVDGRPQSPPADTGEAVGLHPSRLTITFGFGPSLFGNGGSSRFGIGAQRPPALADIPPFMGDALDPARSNGDICVQACADDPQVAFHAVRNLARIGRGKVVMRWNQLGFGRTATTSRTQETPRNLMGVKDGTNNVRAEDQQLLSDHVWVGDEGPAWMRGGTYMVTRRIRMLIEAWDRAPLDDQEQTIGRHKGTGAPLGLTREKDAVDLSSTTIPRDAHVRLAAPMENGGAHLLRRGYSFTDGMDAMGQLDAGLFFIAFQRDIRSHFNVVQEKLSRNDALNEYIKHTSSAAWAVPAGANRGDFVGSALFA